MQLGGGEEGVVTSLRWQTDIKDLQLDIITIDLTTEPLDMGFYFTVSLEPSPRSGLDVDLVWTQLPHSLDTQSTPHPQTREYALPDLTSAEAAMNCWKGTLALAQRDYIGVQTFR